MDSLSTGVHRVLGKVITVTAQWTQPLMLGGVQLESLQTNFNFTSWRGGGLDLCSPRFRPRYGVAPSKCNL